MTKWQMGQGTILVPYGSSANQQQEVEICCVVGKEEEKVGNNETASHNEYSAYKFAFLFLHTKYTHFSKEKAKRLITVSQQPMFS